MIKKKIFYYIEFELKSPISIGNGSDILTDHDCLRNMNGIPFIPASTLAGIFSHYLSNENRNIFLPTKIFKNNEGATVEENILSPYFISDANICDKTTLKTSIRDGVGLNENKVAIDGAKYDFEVVETGTKFTFRIEVTIRDNDEEEKMKQIVDIILNGINSGEILIGLKQNRGYGKAKITLVKYKEFKKENISDLLSFKKYEKNNYNDYTINNSFKESKYDFLEFNLEQIGGISIRKYSAEKGDVDFEHIKSNGCPIIPGTSWAGLIRKSVKDYINELNIKDLDLSNWFGVEKSKNSNGQASNIIFEESTIKDGKEILLTRNKIDRFYGGASNRALFSEKAIYNGKTTLRIKIKKTPDNRKIISVICLAIKDLDNGLIALGGQTSIGRGIFKLTNNENICKFNNQEKTIDSLIGGDF